jgi:hypothetical protein
MVLQGPKLHVRHIRVLLIQKFTCVAKANARVGKSILLMLLWGWAIILQALIFDRNPCYKYK